MGDISNIDNNKKHSSDILKILLNYCNKNIMLKNNPNCSAAEGDSDPIAKNKKRKGIFSQAFLLNYTFLGQMTLYFSLYVWNYYCVPETIPIKSYLVY